MDTQKQETTNDQDQHVLRGSSENRYQRPRIPHKAVGTIDDMDHAEEDAIDYTSDTEFTSATGLFKNRAWKKSNQAIPQLQRDCKYGQYLYVPKAQKSIFTAQQDKRRRRLTSTILIVVIICIAAFLFIFNYL